MIVFSRVSFASSYSRVRFRVVFMRVFSVVKNICNVVVWFFSVELLFLVVFLVVDLFVFFFVDVVYDVESVECVFVLCGFVFFVVFGVLCFIGFDVEMKLNFMKNVVNVNVLVLV